MTTDVQTFQYTFNMAQTLAIATSLLLIGKWVKEKVNILQKFFIPAPVVGGLIFATITLIGHSYNLFEFKFDSQLKTLLMLAFFTNIGFAEIIKMLLKGGLEVMIFLAVSIALIIVQNMAGIALSAAFGLNKLLGLAAGSIALTGGHGTAAVFGEELAKAGVSTGTSVSVAAATFGLVAGCVIGGPIAKKLMLKYNLKSTSEGENTEIIEGKLTKEEKNIDENLLFKALMYIIISMGAGSFISLGFSKLGIVFPEYLGPMIIASCIRNYMDKKNKALPLHSINVVGSISLQLFLGIALMTMQLWDLASLAIPLITILLVQTVIMACFAYFVTFRIMGKDYDAAVIATGHCGFGMGASPNAIANMETFTAANGYSPKAFFVVPIVGAMFIDFVNGPIISFFMGVIG